MIQLGMDLRLGSVKPGRKGSGWTSNLHDYFEPIRFDWRPGTTHKINRILD